MNSSCKVFVSPPPNATARQYYLLPALYQLPPKSFPPSPNPRSHWRRDQHLSSSRAMSQRPLPAPTRRSFKELSIPHMGKTIHTLVGGQHHIASAPTIPSIRASTRHVTLPPKAQCSRASIPCFDPNRNVIYQQLFLYITIIALAKVLRRIITVSYVDRVDIAEVVYRGSASGVGSAGRRMTQSYPQIGARIHCSEGVIHRRKRLGSRLLVNFCLEERDRGFFEPHIHWPLWRMIQACRRVEISATVLRRREFCSIPAAILSKPCSIVE